MNRWSVFAVLLILSAAGCIEREVVTDLDARESIEALVVLNRSGIIAEREKLKSGRGTLYRITVSENDIPRSMQVLHEYGIPHAVTETVESVTRQKGMVPNMPEITAARLDHALSLEVERLISALPNIVSARVSVRSHLRQSNSRDDVSDAAKANVLVRYVSASGKNLVDERKIKTIVAQVVPGLLTENVEVDSTPIFLPNSGGLIAVEESGTVQTLTTLWPFTIQVVSGNEMKARQQLFVVVIIAALLGIAIGLFGRLGFYHRRRRRFQERSGNGRRQVSSTKSHYLEGGPDRPQIQ